MNGKWVVEGLKELLIDFSAENIEEENSILLQAPKLYLYYSAARHANQYAQKCSGSSNLSSMIFQVEPAFSL